MTIEQQAGLDAPPANSPPRVLAVTCGNHAVHDGYTTPLYLLLPLALSLPKTSAAAA